MSVVSTLVVRLTADSKGLTQGFASAEKQANKWGKAHRVATAGAAAGLTAITGLAVKSMSTYKDFGSTVNKLSGLMNVSTEDASRLVGQWKRFGIEGQTGATAVKFLSKNIEAAKGGSKEAADSFAKLGISVKDLSKMSAAEVMMRARDSMSQMGDKTQRTATMLKLFGRSGTEMLGWVKQSPQAIGQVNESLSKLGLVWGDKQLKTYKDLSKAQAENKLVWMGFQMTLAQTLVPTLTSILGLFQKVLWAIQPVAPLLKYVAAGLAAFLIAGKIASTGNALMAFAKSVKIVTAAQWLWNAAMSANPIALVVIAIAALVAALVIAYKRSATFRKIVQAAFHGILVVGRAVMSALVAVVRWCWEKMKAIWAGLSWLVDYFRKNWRLILAAVTGPIGLMLAFVVKHWDKIKAATKAAWTWVKNTIKDVLAAILKAFRWYSDTYRSVLGRAWTLIKSGVGAAWDWVKDKTTGVWQGIVRTIAGFVNQIIRIVNLLPGVNIKYVSWGSGTAARAGTQGRGGVNAYAKGAIVNGPELALVGEDGPELILPLSKPRRMKSLLRQAGITPYAEGGIIGKLTGFLGDVWGGVSNVWGNLKGLLGRLSIPKLPSLLGGFLPAVVKMVFAKIKDTFSGGRIIEIAKQYLGVPYVWGGTSPKGFDCSGFAQYVYRQAGISIQRVATAQAWNSGGRWTKNPHPGDLAFFHKPGDARNFMHHVGIFAGGGRMIDAPHTGANVRYDPLWNDLYGFKSWMGSGGSFVATTPTMFGAGERGPELVSVKPLSASVATPEPGAAVVNDFSGAIFVDSTRAGVERLWNLAVRGGETVEARREKVRLR